MKCPDEFELQLYLEQGLVMRREKRLSRHLEKCPACADRLQVERKRLEDFRRFLVAVSEKPEPALTAQEILDSGKQVRFPGRRRWPALVAGAVAALLVVLVGFVIVAGLPKTAACSQALVVKACLQGQEALTITIPADKKDGIAPIFWIEKKI